MYLPWNDTAAIARRLNNIKALDSVDLIMLDPDDVENMVISQKICNQPLPDGDVRLNTLNSIAWRWMRLRTETIREAG